MFYFKNIESAYMYLYLDFTEMVLEYRDIESRICWGGGGGSDINLSGDII